MKLLPLVLVLLTGCTMTKIQVDRAGKWTLNRWSMFQRVDIPVVTINSNGTVTMRGYRNDGGSEAIGAVAEGVAKGVVEGMK